MTATETELLDALREANAKVDEARVLMLEMSGILADAANQVLDAIEALS